MGLGSCGRPGSSLCPSPGLAGSSLPGGCRAPGCLMKGFIQPGSSFPRCSLGDPTPMYGCERWHWPVPTVPVTAPSATEEHRGFCPEPHWGGDGLLSLFAVRGTVRELGQAVLHPGAIWDGHRGAACGDGAHRTGLCALGTGAGAGVASRGADPGAVQAGTEHHLRELRSLLRDSLEISGDLLHLPAFCWPCIAHSSPGPSSPLWLLWCARAQPPGLGARR